MIGHGGKKPYSFCKIYVTFCFMVRVSAQEVGRTPPTYTHTPHHHHLQLNHLISVSVQGGGNLWSGLQLLMDYFVFLLQERTSTCGKVQTVSRTEATHLWLFASICPNSMLTQASKQLRVTQPSSA